MMALTFSFFDWIYLSLDKFSSKNKNCQFRLKFGACNQFHNILKLFDVLPNFPFTTSEKMGDYY